MEVKPLPLMVGGKISLSLNGITSVELLEYLGGGGFGSVWKVIDRHQQRFYTLKIIQNVEGKGLDIERVRRESEVTIASDYIIPVIGLHEWSAHVFLILFEYFSGQALDIRLRTNNLSSEQKQNIFNQVLYGVSDAHRNNIIHRDLKPSNILVGNDDSVKLIDFGISKFKEQNITTPGITFGTPPYMAPELLSLGSYCADARSDIYALGQLLYELVTGKTFWAYKGWRRVGDLITFMRQSPPPEAVMELSTFHCDFYPNAGQILLRMVQIDPAKRFSSIDEIIEEVGLPANIAPVDTASHAHPVLIIESGTNRNARTFFRIADGQAVVLGRADFAGNDGSISRRHLEVIREGDRYLVRDLGSKHGTMIGGSLLGPDDRFELNHGDRVRVGDLFLRFAFLQRL